MKMLLVAAVMLVCASCSTVPVPTTPAPQAIVGPTYPNPPQPAAHQLNPQQIQNKVDDLTAGVKRLQQLLNQGK